MSASLPSQTNHHLNPSFPRKHQYQSRSCYVNAFNFFGMVVIILIGLKVTIGQIEFAFEKLDNVLGNEFDAVSLNPR